MSVHITNQRESLEVHPIRKILVHVCITNQSANLEIVYELLIREKVYNCI